MTHEDKITPATSPFIFIHSFIFVYFQLSKRNRTWTRRCN